MDTFTIPAGTYVLGDPCYAVPNEDWHDFIVAMGWPQMETGVWKNYTLFKGFHCVAFNTKWGDGIYTSNENHVLPVDAGLIGLVPIEYAGSTSWGSHEVTFDTPVVCSTDGDGFLTFGHITVDTDDDEEYDEYEDDPYDWDEEDEYQEV